MILATAPSSKPESSPPAAARGDLDAFDAVKGLLILLIVLGHLTPMQHVPGFGWVFPVLYRFHVVSFLLLPFLLGRAKWQARWLADRAVRYLVPYAIWVSATAVVFGLTVGAGVAPAELVRRTAWGLLTGYALDLKAATGFQLYWFLPALFTVTLLRAVLMKVPQRWLPVVVLAAWTLHGTVALWLGVWSHAPLGLAVAVYVLPMGVTAAWLWPFARRWPWIVACAAVALAITTRWMGLYTNVGVLGVFGWRNPAQMLITDIDAIASFLAIVAAAPVLGRIPGLPALGRLSLGVYLCHSAFLQSVLLTGLHAGRQPFGQDAAVFAVIGMVVALVGGILSARLMQLNRVQPWVLPRGLSDWTATRRWFAGVRS
jgi:fucose 4-O-acetylase-like acetyltransferase